MSRSKRKNPVRGITTSESEKADKVAAHRRVRRRVKTVIQSPPESETETLPHERELSNPWAMAKDGKARFDPVRHRELLRK